MNMAEPLQFILPLAGTVVADWFAGGGGMAEGIKRAIGRHVDVSCNHDDDAISMHRVNHPQARHLVEDVRSVCARLAAQYLPVDLFHMSPDCTHHSQAKGGQPRDRALRALTWVGLRWAGQVRPRIITLENVKQILQWGPLIAKRDPATGRVLKLDGTVAAAGERVPVQQQFLVPDPARAGQTWCRFVTILRAMGYVVDWRVLCAADYGVRRRRAAGCS
jgi:DNA (cytosine-5)-methyltransferase 1